MEQHLLIRVDASTEIGTGHFMRCLALAQAWKDAGNKVIFITNCQNDSLLQRLREEGFELHVLPRSYPDLSDWDYTKDVLAGYPDAWVVLDGYHFDEVYQQKVKEAGHPLLVIDDMAYLRHYYADIVLNQNWHAEQLHYSCEPYTQLLLGTRYVLLRREFLAWKDCKREIPEVARHILVTLGGSDPDNLTLKVIQALQGVKAPDLEVKVVIGASNPHTDELETTAKQGRIPTQLIRDAPNMPELMAWADVAVSSAGTTVWELMFMRVPTLVLVLAPNQELNAQTLKERGIALSLSRGETPSSAKLNQLIQELLVNKQVRLAMSQAGRDIMDGQGAERITKTILNHSREAMYDR